MPLLSLLLGPRPGSDVTVDINAMSFYLQQQWLTYMTEYADNAPGALRHKSKTLTL